MDRIEIADVEHGAAGASGPEAFLQLGMLYSSGRSVPADLVTAHKWFNIAAMRGAAEAALHRREIAAQMGPAQIAAAQRAARDWVARH